MKEGRERETEKNDSIWGGREGNRLLEVTWQLLWFQITTNWSVS